MPRMGAKLIAGIVSILQFALMTFLAAIAVNILVAVVAHLYAAVIRHAGREDLLRDKIVRYSRICTGLQDRLDLRKNAASGAASKVFSAQRHEKQLRTRVRELEAAPYRFVRIVGTEQVPNRPYEFLVINSSVSHQVKRGEKHPFFDSCWARPCPVHVWAKSPEEAKAEFERVFPKASGFKIVFAQPLQMDGSITRSTPAIDFGEGQTLTRPASATSRMVDAAGGATAAEAVPA